MQGKNIIVNFEEGKTLKKGWKNPRKSSRKYLEIYYVKITIVWYKVKYNIKIIHVQLQSLHKYIVSVLVSSVIKSNRKCHSWNPL